MRYLIFFLVILLLIEKFSFYKFGNINSLSDFYYLSEAIKISIVAFVISLILDLVLSTHKN